MVSKMGSLSSIEIVGIVFSTQTLHGDLQKSEIFDKKITVESRKSTVAILLNI